MAQDLVNCKKCGTLYVKNSRGICDNCLKSEIALVDRVKAHIAKNSKMFTLEELAVIMGTDKAELEELFERGRFFSVANKILIKCKFCGIEIQDEGKTSFVCQKCLQKFSPGTRTSDSGTSEQTEPKKVIRRRIDPASKKTRYGFILGYEL